MKKIVLIAAFLLASYVGHSQVYRIATVGESKQFVITDTVSGVRERPYLNREVLADTTSEGRINIYRQLGVDYLKPIGFPSPKGHPYTAFLDGNNSDATFESAAAVDTWFKNYTGFNTAGGSASTTAENVSVGTSSDVVFDISVGTSGAPAAPYTHLTQNYLINNGKEAAYCQGGWFKDTMGSSIIQRYFPALSLISGGNLDGVEQALSWAASFKVEGAFSFRIDGYDTQLPLYTVEVDGVDYSITNNNGVGVGRRWMTVDAGPGVHYVKVKGSLNAFWTGYHTAPNALAEPWDVNRTTLYFGDSFTAGTGAAQNSSGYAYSTVIGTNHNIIASGSSGTGYVNSGVGKYKLSDRIIADYIDIEAANGVPNEVVIALGINDIGQAGIEAAADLAFDNLRTVYSGKVYVVGPWDTNAPSSPVTNYSTTKTAIKNALVGRDGFYFIDVQGVSFTKSDGTHPDNAGHAVLGAYIKKSLYPVPNTNMLRYSERIASQVPFTAVGDISSTNVQDAIDEVGNKNYKLLTSPDGTVYRITVANGGTLSIVED